MKSIFDASFKYTPSFSTDVRKTFDRIRQEQHGADHGQRSGGCISDTKANVVPLGLLKQGT